MIRMTFIRARMATVMVAALAIARLGVLAEDESSAGSAPGAEVPSFYVRPAVSEMPGAATCLVCRYGQRPVVMLCVRRLDDCVSELITQVDRYVDSHRGEGLRGMAVFLDADQRQLQPELARLIRQKNLSLPLTFPVEASGPRGMELPRDAQLTVLLYRDRKVQSRFVYKQGEFKSNGLRDVLAAVEKFARE